MPTTMGYDLDGMERARNARVARLKRDPQFFDESTRIKTDLKEVLNNYPGLFDKFFRQFSELSVRLGSKDLDRFLNEIPGRAREILLDYIAYARRFRVWLTWQKGSFKTRLTGPWQTKFRAQLADGFLREIRPEEPGVMVFENERFVDDDLNTPTDELEKLRLSGQVKYFQLEDGNGKSAFHQIEDIAYDPESITFILHKGSRDYLYCLVGENVPIDSLWRDAGTAVNSLQLQLYGRKKAGRPRKLGKWKKAAKLREEPEGKSLKEKAFELLDTSTGTLASAQSFLSKAGRKVITKRSK